MSSPKRVDKTPAKIPAKTAPKAAAKAAMKSARRPAMARPAPQLSHAAGNGASAEIKRVAATLERSIVDGDFAALPSDALQALIAAACRVYTARTEAGEQFTPVPRNSISATDVMVTASGLLRAVDLAVFELGMWQSWTGR
jgi:hypothetical protein